jgi:hypothetical protein
MRQLVNNRGDLPVLGTVACHNQVAHVGLNVELRTVAHDIFDERNYESWIKFTSRYVVPNKQPCDVVRRGEMGILQELVPNAGGCAVEVSFVKPMPIASQETTNQYHNEEEGG